MLSSRHRLQPSRACLSSVIRHVQPTTSSSRQPPDRLQPFTPAPLISFHPSPGPAAGRLGTRGEPSKASIAATLASQRLQRPNRVRPTAAPNVEIVSAQAPEIHIPRPDSVPMATTDAAEPHDRQAHRRRPFSTWVKRLTGFKSSSDGERSKRHMKTRKGTKLNNPYPESGQVSRSQGNGSANADGRDVINGDSANSFVTAQTGSIVSADAVDGHAPPTAGGGGMARTASAENEGPRSITAPSHGTSSLAGTSRTAGGGLDSRRGGDSTFSSPAPSVRSLTTTLTTIQSMAPNGHHAPAPAQTNPQSTQFSQPFPTTLPASAIPAHLAPVGHPNTYTAATANNLLTDNASILTLASSSKRRRRRSMDTDASVRALAPSSLWGGSRESLPLSVLSANVESTGNATTPGLHGSGSRIGAERNSIYSATGVAPALPSERSSVYARQGDGASVRSGLLGHGRPDSISGTNVGVTSPLASPREVPDEMRAKDDKDES
ncbi:hypothetical protein TOPH_07677 [Tolypocladium ophioglossoides CBS 100239]|uniref:Ca2+-modulated nonselective cation channel polycystin n=1 Tax=Tolypocladium ophioglossoides (strain CBS 100239) TaxID=1163406 RepID=A0A0L0N0V2_TOLOC|nr:hypothetical protein TOPH_07677 [Tolypocladium ophioglossoides CBS 100239]